MNSLYKIFFTIVVISLLLLFYISYNNHSFKTNPLPKDTIARIDNKKKELKKLVYENYGFKRDIPIHISSKLDNNLYGLAVYSKGDIKIILNKNRFQESEDYMIDYVLPHEYAHTVMFLLGDFTRENSGHSLRWQNICLSLKGKKCDRYVDHQDIVLDKLDFVY